MISRLRPQRTMAERAAMEIADVLDRLHHDVDWAITFWASYRDRARLLAIVDAGWREVPAADLLELTPAQLAACEAFHRELARFAAWLRFTEAMPATTAIRFEQVTARLVPLGEAALDALGGVPAPAPD